MDHKLHDSIEQVQKEPHDNNTWLVLADRLQELGNEKGELISLDVALRNGLDHDEARQTLREAREKVWDIYGLKEVPEYLLQDKFWRGSFPLRFPNTERLEELDSVFADEFPHYELLPRTSTYVLGVHQLRRHCEAQEKSKQPKYPRGNNQTMYRPFTFRENILARVEDFYTLYDQNGEKRDLKDRLRLFNTWFDSCTGIAYKSDSSQFKIILQSPHLIGIDENFNEEYLSIDYDSIQGEGVIELDRNNGTYRELLSQSQVLNHLAWNAALEEDKPLLKEHTNIVFSRNKGNNMGFWLRDNIEQDHLRALFVNDLNYNSNAYGNYNLNYIVSFLAR